MRNTESQILSESLSMWHLFLSDPYSKDSERRKLGREYFHFLLSLWAQSISKLKHQRLKISNSKEFRNTGELKAGPPISSHPG